MKKIGTILCSLLFFVGCKSVQPIEVAYKRISPYEAQLMMEEMTEDYLLVDVRTTSEFGYNHIVDAINVPLDDILNEDVSQQLPDKNQIIFIYCRSGNRSQTASAKLCELGYTNIIEMGGIINWYGPIIGHSELEK